MASLQVLQTFYGQRDLRDMLEVLSVDARNRNASRRYWEKKRGQPEEGR